nr:hypothetical protein [Tanacetum cinerariifolium]
ADYARCKDTFKSTSSGSQLLGEKLTDYQLADIFTKSLPADRFNYLVRRLGKAKKSVRLMMYKLFEMELELILLLGITYYCWVNVKAVEEQSWFTAMAKTINGEAQIHARVDGKKVIISKASIGRDFQFADDEGVDCLPNSTIIEQLASMGLTTAKENILSDLEKSELMVLGYKTGLKSVEERLDFSKKNRFIYREDIQVLKFEIQMKDIAIGEHRKKLEKAQKEKYGIHLTVDKLENASKGLNKLIECQIVDNCKKWLGYENYNAVSPPYTGNFMPLKPDLSFTSLDEFVNKPVVKNSQAKSIEKELKVVSKNNDALIIEE